MDDINEEDPNAGRCESVHVSKSGERITVLRTSENDNAVEKQETGKCRHFSIRRYVAETRKKDWKSSWPFLRPEDPHKLEEYPMFLPSLSVPEFRWWHCQNCLKNNGTDRAGEVLMNCLGEQRPNIALVDGRGLLPSDNSTKLLHEVQSPSGKSKGEENAAAYVLKSNAPENDVTSIHPFSGDASEKMVQYASPEQDNQVTENNVNQINYETICDVIDAEPCKRGERVTEEAGEVTITFDLNKPACDLSFSETISTSRPVSCEPVASETVVSKSLGNEEGLHEVLPNQEIFVIGSHLASPISMKKGIAEPDCMNDLEVSVEITKDHGGSQLADVVTGEEICHNGVAIPVSELDFLELAESDDGFPPDNYNLDTGESPCGPSNVILQQKRMKRMRSMTDILKSEHLVCSNENNRNPSKNKGNKQKKVPGVENSESSLMCRPKDMLEKLQGHVIDDENNRPEIDTESKTEEKDKGNISAEKENSWVAREEMQHLTLDDDDFSREPATKNNDTAQSKNIMSKKSKNLPRIHDFNSLPQNPPSPFNFLFQESPGIGKGRTFQDSKLPQEVIAHKRAAPVNNERHQSASLDDIPMDIVELLAKNQQERCLQHDEAAKEGRVDKSETAQNKSFNVIDLTGKSMENYEKKLKNSSHTSSNLNDIGLKQPERCAQGFVPWSQSKQKKTGYQFRSPDLSRDCERMSLTCSQWLEQCHKNQMGLPKSSFGPSKHGASVPLHTILHDTSSTKPSSSTTPEGSYNLNSTNLDFYLQSQQNKVKFQAEMNREHFVPSKHGASVPLHTILHDTSSTKPSSSTTPEGSYNLNSTNLDFYLQSQQNKVKFQAEMNREHFVPSKHGASVPLHTILHDTSSIKPSSSTTPEGSYNLNSTNLDFYLQSQQNKVKFQAEMNREHFVPSKHGASVPLHTILHDTSSTKPSSSTTPGGSYNLNSTNLDFYLQSQQNKVKFQAEMNREHFVPSKHGASVPLHTILHDTSSTKASSSTTPGGSYNLNSTNLKFYLQSQKNKVKFQAEMNREHFVPSKHGASVPLHTILHDTSSTKSSSSTPPGGSYNLNSTNLDFYLQSQKNKVKFQAEMNREHYVPYSYPNAAKGPSTGEQMELQTRETIPAMHLLRLMNQGAYSSTPATLRMHENQGSFLQKNHFGQARKFFDLESSGIAETNRPSLHHKSFQSIHQKLQQGKPFELLPPMARVSSVGSPLPDIPTHSNSYGLPVGFTSGFHTEMQASSSQAHEEKKTRNSQSLGPSTNLRPNDFVPAVNISSYTDALRLRGILTGHNIEQNNQKAPALPVESSSNTEFCSVNRNPAEFSMPEDGNIYMIGSEDLKCRNLSPLKDPDARKRQRTLKLTAIQGC
ncbi:protein EMBRYONIC FLOWER 1-like [Aristolochia californica]|uniref:protein EMBRYONIC FLOWER 1-like n=1 Tax=Aristolochia californica TaxID=171875 RepID=UPI0035E2665E